MNLMEMIMVVMTMTKRKRKRKELMERQMMSTVINKKTNRKKKIMDNSLKLMRREQFGRTPGWRVQVVYLLLGSLEIDN